MPPRKAKAAAPKKTSTRKKAADPSPEPEAQEDDSASMAVDAAAASSSDSPLPLNPAEVVMGALASAVSSGVEAVVEGVHRAEAALDSMVDAELPSAEPIVEAVREAEGTVEGVVEKMNEAEVPSVRAAVRKGKGKAREVLEHAAEDVPMPALPEAPPSAAPAAKATMEERQAKLKELRLKMNASSAANRKDLITDHQRQKTSAKELASLEKKKKLAEQLREQADAEENGEDLERAKNWGWSIEDSEKWDAKLVKKEAGANKGLVDEAHSAHTRYDKMTDVGTLKPDLQAYNRQRETALGLPSGTLTGPSSASSSKALARMPAMTSDSLYRDANSLHYADHKPSQDAIDNVVSKLNKEMESRANHSRKRANEDDGDVTYINDQNKVFNKKITRYYDKYTKEIRASFERGTAL